MTKVQLIFNLVSRNLEKIKNCAGKFDNSIMSD